MSVSKLLLLMLGLLHWCAASTLRCALLMACSSSALVGSECSGACGLLAGSSAHRQKASPRSP
jgi:hypothetical protein